MKKTELKRKTPLKAYKGLKRTPLKSSNKPLKRSYIKKKPYKKIERYSLLTSNMNKCYVCGETHNIEIHEVFFGPFRSKSIEYNCTVPLCKKHHTSDDGVHFDKELDLRLKKEMQREFEKEYSHEEYMEIFKKNYL